MNDELIRLRDQGRAVIALMRQQADDVWHLGGHQDCARTLADYANRIEALLTALPPPQLVEHDLSQVTRVEVINETGRVYRHRPCTVQLSYQDAGRTLKVLVNWPPIHSEVLSSLDVAAPDEPTR